MNLQFDNLNELEQFLMFSAHIGRAFMPAPAGNSPINEGVADVQETVTNNGTSTAPNVNLSSGEQAGQDAGAGSVGAEPAETEVNGQGKEKRKRRTKAEIEAERVQAELAAGAAGAQPDTFGTVPATGADFAGANPFAQASPATQAILEAPNQSAATLAGIAAMQSNPPTNEAPAPEIASIDHLRACQSFIQAHGMTKYNESFKDGLHVNIVNYTPEQRAQHVAILNELAA